MNAQKAVKQHADPRARDHIVTPIVITPASVSPVAGLIKTHSLLLNQLRPIIEQLCSSVVFKTEIDSKVLDYTVYHFNTKT